MVFWRARKLAFASLKLEEGTDYSEQYVHR